MTNREKYAEEILDIACNGGGLAVLKTTGKPESCDKICCSDCKFNLLKDCSENVKKWANAEYIENLKISKRDKEFLNYLKPGWEYMTRNQDGSLRVFSEKPNKHGIVWDAEYVFGAYNLTFGTNVEFQMVRWEDKEPWSIEDLKNLEVIEEYELCN